MVTVSPTFAKMKENIKFVKGENYENKNTYRVLI